MAVAVKYQLTALPQLYSNGTTTPIRVLARGGSSSEIRIGLPSLSPGTTLQCKTARLRVAGSDLQLAFKALRPGWSRSPLDRLGALDSCSIALAKTESRTVLGYMNEMARFCEYAVGDAGGLVRRDARELNRELRRELHLSSRPPGYFVPIELAANRGTDPKLRIVD